MTKEEYIIEINESKTRLIEIIKEIELQNILIWNEKASTFSEKTAIMMLEAIIRRVKSLNKLDMIDDFELICASGRAGLEILIDCILLFEKGKEVVNCKKLFDWEESAYYKHANQLIKILKTDDKISPIWEKFVISVRTYYSWFKKNKPDHPTRWTNQDIIADAHVADKLKPSLNLKIIAEKHYTELCWQTHGSGIFGDRTHFQFPEDVRLHLVSTSYWFFKEAINHLINHLENIFPATI